MHQSAHAKARVSLSNAFFNMNAESNFFFCANVRARENHMREMRDLYVSYVAKREERNGTIHFLSEDRKNSPREHRAGERRRWSSSHLPLRRAMRDVLFPYRQSFFF